MSKNNFEKNTSQKIPLKQTEVCNDACYLVPPGIAITKTGSIVFFIHTASSTLHRLANPLLHSPVMLKFHCVVCSYICMYYGYGILCLDYSKKYIQTPLNKMDFTFARIEFSFSVIVLSQVFLLATCCFPKQQLPALHSTSKVSPDNIYSFHGCEAGFIQK